MRKKITKKLIKNTGCSLGKSALNIRNGGKIISDILKLQKPKVILEIGTYKGVTAAFMSQFCEKLITIDLVNGRLEKTDVYSDINRSHLWSRLGINNIIFIQINNNKEKFNIMRNLDFDFAFIDGAHDKSVKNDFKHVRHCGKVLFHDYDTRGQDCLDHVYNFVNSLPKDEIDINDIFAFWRNNVYSS